MTNELLAQITNPVIPHSIGQGTTANGATAAGLFISKLIGGMMLIGFFTAFIYLITGAFHWITSAGDKANLENARNRIIHALVGLIVLASVWAVATVAAQFIGLDIQNLPIPTLK